MVLKLKMQEPQAAAAKHFKLVLGRYLIYPVRIGMLYGRWGGAG